MPLMENSSSVNVDGKPYSMVNRRMEGRYSQFKLVPAVEEKPVMALHTGLLKLSVKLTGNRNTSFPSEGIVELKAIDSDSL